MLSPSPHAANKRVGISDKPSFILDLLNICWRGKVDTSLLPPQAVTNNGRVKSIFLFTGLTKSFLRYDLNNDIPYIMTCSSSIKSVRWTQSVDTSKHNDIIVPWLDALGFVRSKGPCPPVDHVLVAVQGVTSPETQKPQRERRGFYKFSGGPGRNRTTDTRIFNPVLTVFRL